MNIIIMKTKWAQHCTNIVNIDVYNVDDRCWHTRSKNDEDDLHSIYFFENASIHMSMILNKAREIDIDR